MNKLLQKSIVGLSLLPLSSLTLALTVSFTQVGELSPRLDTVEKPVTVSDNGVVAMRTTDNDLVTWNTTSGTNLIAPSHPDSWIWPSISPDGNTVLFSSFHSASGSPGSQGDDFFYQDGVLTVYAEPQDSLANIYAMSSDGNVLGGSSTNYLGPVPALFTGGDFTTYRPFYDRQMVAGLNETGNKFVSMRNYTGVTSGAYTPYVWTITGTNTATYVQSSVSMSVKDFSADGSIVLGRLGAANYWSAPSTALWNADTDQHTEINDLYYPIAFSSDASVIVGNSKKASISQAANIMSIWDNVNGVRDLEQLIISYGIDLNGWSNMRVQNISEDGSKIVGSGTNPEGNDRIFVLDLIPECSTYL